MSDHSQAQSELEADERRAAVAKIMAENPSLTAVEAAAWFDMQRAPKVRCCPCQSWERAEIISHKGKRCTCQVGLCECNCHGVWR
jgi:hypothetical protein